MQLSRTRMIGASLSFCHYQHDSAAISFSFAASLQSFFARVKQIECIFFCVLYHFIGFANAMGPH